MLTAHCHNCTIACSCTDYDEDESALDTITAAVASGMQEDDTAAVRRR